MVLCFETLSPNYSFFMFSIAMFRAMFQNIAPIFFSFLNVAQKHSNRKHKKWKKMETAMSWNIAQKHSNKKHRKWKIWMLCFEAYDKNIAIENIRNNHLRNDFLNIATKHSSRKRKKLKICGAIFWNIAQKHSNRK